MECCGSLSQRLRQCLSRCNDRRSLITWSSSGRLGYRSIPDSVSVEEVRPSPPSVPDLGHHADPGSDTDRTQVPTGRASNRCFSCSFVCLVTISGNSLVQEKPPRERLRFRARQRSSQTKMPTCGSGGVTGSGNSPYSPAPCYNTPPGDPRGFWYLHS